jgi:hypothetical protein
MRKTMVLALALLAGCGPSGPPPPPLWFDGLPVSGSRADARKAGFDWCIKDNIEMRCRRNGVMFLGKGPYNAALDLAGRNGRAGFNQLTLWHDRDQGALLEILEVLDRQGWGYCYTGIGDRGDQAIYVREGSPVRISMDLSYWGKRRLRVLPERGAQVAKCSFVSRRKSPDAQR